MSVHKNIPYYLTAIGLFVMLKFAFTLADNDDLVFLLYPIDKLTGLLTGSYSYFSENGYYNPKLNILIDKSCSGFNFWLLSFVLITYLKVKYSYKFLHKFLAIPISLAFAYLLTIFVNTSRIFVSIVVQSQSKIILAGHQHLIHETIGIITNLSFLVLTFYLSEKFLHTRYHAKSA